MFVRFLPLILTCSALAGCATAYPTSSVEQGSADGIVVLSGSHPGQRVLADGVDKGEAVAFDGAHGALHLAPGPHHIRVVDGSSTVLDEPVYVGAGSRIEVKVRS